MAKLAKPAVKGKIFFKKKVSQISEISLGSFRSLKSLRIRKCFSNQYTKVYSEFSIKRFKKITRFLIYQKVSLIHRFLKISKQEF